MPHVVWTSDSLWDPSVLDNVISDDNDWKRNVNVPRLERPFNDYGNYTGREYVGMEEERDGIEALVYDTSNLNAQDKFDHRKPAFLQDIELFDDDNDDYEIIEYCDDILVRFKENKMLSVNANERKLSDNKYKELRPCFLYNSKEVIERTLEATTQYGRSILSGPLMRNTYRSPFPANNVLRRHEPVATDTVKASVAAIGTGGITIAQFYIGRNSHVADAFGMLTEKQFVNTLEDTIQSRGAMDLLISDSAKVETSGRVGDLLRSYKINDWQSEPHFQHQNFAERGYRDIKARVIVIMNATGANPNEWLLILKYVIFIHNRMAVKSLGWITPLEKLTGQTPDVSIIYQMPYRTVVYFKRYDGQYPDQVSSQGVGFFVGFAETVGHDNTFLVLTHDTKKVIARSRLRLANELPNKRLEGIKGDNGDVDAKIKIETTSEGFEMINPFVGEDISSRRHQIRQISNGEPQSDETEQEAYVDDSFK